VNVQSFARNLLLTKICSVITECFKQIFHNTIQEILQETDFFQLKMHPLFSFCILCGFRLMKNFLGRNMYRAVLKIDIVSIAKG
jgi:hypothetical protein